MRDKHSNRLSGFFQCRNKMLFDQFGTPFGQIVERIGIAALVCPSGEKSKGTPRLPLGRIVGTLALYEPTVIQYRQGIGQRIGVAMALGNVIARLVGTDELRPSIIDIRAADHFRTKFPRLEFSIFRERTRSGIIGTTFGMANHQHHFLAFSEPRNDILERSEIRNRRLRHKITVKVMSGSDVPEERTLVANVITMFAVDGDGLNLAGIGPAAHTQIFLRAMENDTVHNTGTVFVEDTVYQIQAVPNADGVDNVKTVRNADAVNHVQAIANTDAVDDVQAVLDTQAINNVQTISDIYTIYNMDTIFDTQTIYNVYTINHVQAVNDMNAINDMQTVNNVDTINNMQAVCNANAIDNMDAINNIQAIRNAQTVKKTRDILITNAVDDIQAVRDAQAVDKPNGILVAHTIDNVYAILNTQAVDIADDVLITHTVDNIQAVPNAQAIRNTQAIQKASHLFVANAVDNIHAVHNANTIDVMHAVYPIDAVPDYNRIGCNLIRFIDFDRVIIGIFASCKNKKERST